MKQTRAGTPRIILLPEGPRLGRRLRDPDFDRRMTGAIWIGLYLAAVLSPLAVLLLGERPAPRSFWTELSVALGFVGLSVLCLQFALTARFRRVAAPYGVDMILQFHRQISFTAAAFVVAHPVLLIASDHPASLSTLNVLSAPWGIHFGMVALVALALLIGTSVARQPLKLSYEAWRVSHAVLAVLVVATALAHLLTVGQYLDLPWKRNLWDGFIVAMVGLLLYTRFGRPLRLWRRPYEVERVTPERGGCTTIVLRPAGHAGMRFSPGQFAWLRLGRSPFSIEEHPFSFTSSAEAPGAA